MKKAKQNQLLKLLSKSSQPTALHAFLEDGNTISSAEAKFLYISDPVRVINTLRQRGYKVESYIETIGKGKKATNETRFRKPTPVTKLVSKRKSKELEFVLTLD